jgi:predicted ATPase/DNA-binding SARP family transcriptional activator
MPNAIHPPDDTPSPDAPESDPRRLVAFPRPPASKHPSHNLPLELSTFIGREREMAEVKRLLASTRLLTLTGPGGCGKTRLALAVARDLVGSFEEGIWLAELASLSDPELVAQTVASILGVRDQPGHPLAKTLSDYLQPRQLLLILDNCEHLIEACAELAGTLLRTCPDLKVLATSREPLGITGETGWLVPSLSVPDLYHPRTPESLARYEAVRLFVERAAAAAPSFTLTDRNATAMGRVCQHLDGIPLAIELAAARVRALTVEQISQRLNDCFSLLTSGSRVALPRHRTLRATIGWSYELLGQEEQILFQRLSVFSGGFTLEAVEEVCSGEGIKRNEILDVLSRLVDKSLVLVAEPRDGEARYRLLETVRQYGREKLLESGLAEAIRERHAIFFLSLAEEVEPKLKGAESRLWLEWLEAEHDNMRAALRWAADTGEAKTELRLAGALWWFWLRYGYLSEGRKWLEGTLERAEPSAHARARAKVLWGAGFLAFSQVNHPSARSRLEESAEISRKLGDKRGLAYALSFLSLVLTHQGDLASARPPAEDSIRLFREDGEDRWGLGIALTNMGVVLEAHADYDLAVSLFEESATIFRELGDMWPLSIPLRHLGIVASRRGDHVRAEELYRESLAALRELGEKWLISLCLEELAGAACAQGEYDRAARLWGAEETISEAIGATVRALYRADYDRGVEAGRAGLGEEAFKAAWEEGRAMTLEEALAYALDEPAELHEEKNVVRSSAQTASVEVRVPPELRIFALGAARVYRGEYALTPSDWGYAKPRELLYYLLSHPPRTKEQIGLALWPEASTSQLRSSLHRTLHHLRKALGGPEWISFEKGRYSFNRSLEYFYDVANFETKLSAARKVEAKAPARAISLLQEALELYGGDFLEDLTVEGEWALSRQEELMREYQEALLSLGELLYGERRYAQAAEVYRKVIAHDSYLEGAHRELMRSYAALGERGQALKHYQSLVELLREELGSSPTLETTGLYERLRQGADI